VESVDENGKPQLYLVFEYLDSDLKKYIDSHGRGNVNPIPAKTIQVCSDYTVYGVILLTWINKFCLNSSDSVANLHDLENMGSFLLEDWALNE